MESNEWPGPVPHSRRYPAFAQYFLVHTDLFDHRMWKGVNRMKLSATAMTVPTAATTKGQ